LRFWPGGGPFFAAWLAGFPCCFAAAPAFFAAALFFAAPESGRFVPAGCFAWDDGLGFGGESQGLPGVAAGFLGGDGASVRSGGAGAIAVSADRDGIVGAGGAGFRSAGWTRGAGPPAMRATADWSPPAGRLGRVHSSS